MNRPKPIRYCMQIYRRGRGGFLLKFWSTDPWPWYRANLMIDDVREAGAELKRFAESCKEHRRALAEARRR